MLPVSNSILLLQSRDQRLYIQIVTFVKARNISGLITKRLCYAAVPVVPMPIQSFQSYARPSCTVSLQQNRMRRVAFHANP